MHSIILECYEGDILGLSKYVDPVSDTDINTIEEGCIDIYNKICKYCEATEVNIYSLYVNESLMGFFCYFYNKDLDANYLISFCLSVKYRSRRWMRSFYQVIHSHLGNKFYTAIWSKNSRAIKWLTHFGMTIADKQYYENHEITYLICQHHS